MYNAYELFIPVDVSGNLFYVIFYARLIRVSCVVVTPILSSGTRVNLIWICVSCELLVFISCPTFVLLWQFVMYVKLQFRRYYKSRVKERVSGFLIWFA
jgi:hypothetical protein